MFLISCFYFMAPTSTIDTDGIRVKISALTPAVLTEGFCDLTWVPPSKYKGWLAYRKLPHDIFFSYSFQITKPNCNWRPYNNTYLLHGAESFLSSWLVCSYSRNSPHITEPQGSLPHSQASATCLYPGPAQSSPYTHIPPPGDPP